MSSPDKPRPNPETDKTFSRRDVLKLGVGASIALTANSLRPDLSLVKAFVPTPEGSKKQDSFDTFYYLKPTPYGTTELMRSTQKSRRGLFTRILFGKTPVAEASGDSGGEMGEAIANGRFYIETNGSDGKDTTHGYSVTGAIWEEYKNRGASVIWGPPVSRVYTDNIGRECQAFQRGIFQLTKDSNGNVIKVEWDNVFDKMSELQKDEYLLSVRQTPKPDNWSEKDKDKPWEIIKANHRQLLDQNPTIKQAYDAFGPMAESMFGLPTGSGDMGNCFVIRCQRAVFQFWKEDVPWARAGEITVALGGDIAKEVGGIIPQSAIELESKNIEISAGFVTPDQNTLRTAIDPYARAFGIEPSSVQISYKEFRDRQGNTFMAATSQDGTPLLIMENNMPNGEKTWKPATLKLLGQKTDMFMGAYFGGNRTTPDDFTRIKDLIQKEFSIGGIFPGMSITQPNEGQFQLETLRWLIDSRNTTGISQLLIDPIIWPADEPDWMKNKQGADRLNAIRSHVRKIMEEVKKSRLEKPPIVAVYNEADDPNSEEIDIAFQTARSVMPNAILIYADYDNETINGKRYQNTKSIVDRLRTKGLIDGVGLQFRRNAEDIRSKAEFIGTMQSYGIPVYVTEFGVDMRNTGGSQQDRVRIQAEKYAIMIQAALESGTCKGFMDFQLGDRFSVWQDPSYPYSAPNANQTPYDDNLNPKPALFAQKKALLGQLQIISSK